MHCLWFLDLLSLHWNCIRCVAWQRSEKENYSCINARAVALNTSVLFSHCVLNWCGCGRFVSFRMVFVFVLFVCLSNECSNEKYLDQLRKQLLFVCLKFVVHRLLIRSHISILTSESQHKEKRTTAFHWLNWLCKWLIVKCFPCKSVRCIPPLIWHTTSHHETNNIRMLYAHGASI